MFSPCGVWRLLCILEEHTGSKGRIKTSAGMGRSIITPLGTLLNLTKRMGVLWGSCRHLHVGV